MGMHWQQTSTTFEPACRRSLSHCTETICQGAVVVCSCRLQAQGAAVCTASVSTHFCPRFQPVSAACSTARPLEVCATPGQAPVSRKPPSVPWWPVVGRDRGGGTRQVTHMLSDQDLAHTRWQSKSATVRQPPGMPLTSTACNGMLLALQAWMFCAQTRFNCAAT